MSSKTESEWLVERLGSELEAVCRKRAQGEVSVAHGRLLLTDGP